MFDYAKQWLTNIILINVKLFTCKAFIQLFQALQRNDRFFFCVDTVNGDKIPKTESIRELPITENICKSFSKLCKLFLYQISSLIIFINKSYVIIIDKPVRI